MVRGQCHDGVKKAAWCLWRMELQQRPRCGLLLCDNARPHSAPCGHGEHPSEEQQTTVTPHSGAAEVVCAAWMVTVRSEWLKKNPTLCLCIVIYSNTESVKVYEHKHTDDAHSPSLSSSSPSWAEAIFSVAPWGTCRHRWPVLDRLKLMICVLSCHTHAHTHIFYYIQYWWNV